MTVSKIPGAGPQVIENTLGNFHPPLRAAAHAHSSRTKQLGFVFNTARVRARSCFHPYAARIAETPLRVARDESLSSKAWCIPSRRYLTRGHLLSVPAYLSPKRNTLELSRELKILERTIHLLT